MADLLHLSGDRRRVGRRSPSHEVDPRGAWHRASAVINIGEDRKQWESPPRSGVLTQINNRKDGAAGVERSSLLFKTVVGPNLSRHAKLNRDYLNMRDAKHAYGAA